MKPNISTIALLAALPLCGLGASVEIRPGVPDGKPEATIDLATDEGARLVKGQWRYSDTKIIEVDFRGPGPDSQPTGAPIKTYDYTPHAGRADFDDSQWEQISPTTLSQRRSTGRMCFAWYRINITVPERIGEFRSDRFDRCIRNRHRRLCRGVGGWRALPRARPNGRVGDQRLECAEPSGCWAQCQTGPEDPTRCLRNQWPFVQPAHQFYLDAICAARFLPHNSRPGGHHAGRSQR